MVVFPHAKINIGLRITGKRSDGYHDIQTLFYPIAIHDALEVIENKSSNAAPLQFQITGNNIGTPKGHNICEKAFFLLQQHVGKLPPTNIHLHKAIPAGGGLGGGSSDGTFTLQLLNNYYQLGLDENTLHHLALELGSDCPFFLHKKPCIGTGRGEQLQPIDFSLEKYSLFVLNPGIFVSTASAFQLLKKMSDPIDMEAALLQSPDQWTSLLVNDFEAPVFELHPTLLRIKEILYNAGALYASLSGTGSTLYGVFNTPTAIPELESSGYFTKWI